MAKMPMKLPPVILDQIAALTRERDHAQAQAEGLRSDLTSVERTAGALSEAVKSLRVQLEDMRKQRDRAVDEAENERLRARTAERNLDRAMGWVDAKMDRPPELDTFTGRPF